MTEEQKGGLAALQVSLTSETSCFCEICFINTHHPHVLLPSFEGHGHVSVFPAVISNFVTLEELTELLNAANNTHADSVHT